MFRVPSIKSKVLVAKMASWRWNVTFQGSFVEIESIVAAMVRTREWSE